MNKAKPGDLDGRCAFRISSGPAPEMREHGARGPVGYQPTTGDPLPGCAAPFYVSPLFVILTRNKQRLGQYLHGGSLNNRQCRNICKSSCRAARLLSTLCCFNNKAWGPQAIVVESSTIKCCRLAQHLAQNLSPGCAAPLYLSIPTKLA